MSLFLEDGYVSLNKKGEELCGDNVEIIHKNGYTTLVLADGLGSGVKANILATLTSKILSIMASNNIPIEECIKTIVDTLPICNLRKVAYATFSLVHIDKFGKGYLVEFDNPAAIYFNEGNYVELERKLEIMSDKKIYFSNIEMKINDSLLLMSDGVIHAGIGGYLNFGWERTQIIDFLSRGIDETSTAKNIASKLANACYELYDGLCGDDTTVACIKLRNEQPASIMVGPPVNKSLDEEIIKRFISEEGLKIVCGGTTSMIVANYLNTDVDVDCRYFDKEIPPIGRIKGIDLVTEGVVTLRKVLELSNEYLNISSPKVKEHKKNDGASLLAKYLFEKATQIHFYVGTTTNPAHSNLPIDSTMKMKLIEKIGENLKLMGKKVVLEYN